MILADQILRHGYSHHSAIEQEALFDPEDMPGYRRVHALTECEDLARFALSDQIPCGVVERFVFEADMMEAYDAFHAKVGSDTHWRQQLRLPATSVWYEWAGNLAYIDPELHKQEEHFRMRAGVLITYVSDHAGQGTNAGFLFQYCSSLALDRDDVAITTLLCLLLPENGKKRPEIVWTSIPEDQLKEAIAITYSTALYCTFMLTQPRAYEVRHVAPPPKLVRARLRDRKAPPVEYRVVKFHPGAVQVRYEHHPTSTPGESRRLHSVIGHWRKWSDGDLSWVRYHWRGDRSKGVVIHERHVEP